MPQETAFSSPAGEKSGLGPRAPAPGPREGPSALAPGSSGARRHRPAGAAPPPRRPRTGPRLRGEPPRCRGREAGTEQCRGRRALPAPSLPSSRSRREPLKQCWGPPRSVAPVPRPQVSTPPRLSTAPGPGQRKTSNKPLAGGGCLLTTRVLIRVRCGASAEERHRSSLAQEVYVYGQSRGVIPFSCAYLAAASTSGRTSA
jgi:hypothetical protein